MTNVEDDDALLFSVVTVCLNAEKHIGGALDSVIEQSFHDYEIVVVDGGSSDRTVETVQLRAEPANGRLRWQSEPDEGLYDAMNKGLALARGSYIAYLGADDRLAPGALEAVARVVLQDDSVDVISGATRVLGPHGTWDETASERIRRGLPQRAPARHQSIFVRTEALRGAGGFDTRYRIAADYDVYLKLHEHGVRERLISDTLSEFRLGGVSSTSAVSTAREYRDIRIAHGASAAVERLVMWKSALGVWLHAAAMRTRSAVGMGNG